MKDPAPRTPVRTKWNTLVAVCRECAGGKRLAKSLRGSFKKSGQREVRVIASSCLDVCPKRGVTVATTHAGGVSVAVLDATLEGEAARAAAAVDSLP
jgi:hypothetical protein